MKQADEEIDSALLTRKQNENVYKKAAKRLAHTFCLDILTYPVKTHVLYADK